MLHRNCAALIIAGLLLLSLACSSSNDAADASGVEDVVGQVTRSVGPEGATIELPGGATLEVPAGALATDVTLTATLVSPPEQDEFKAVGPFFEFGPEGQEFALPLVLRIPVEDDAEAVDQARLALVWQHGDEPWGGLPTAVVDDGGQLLLVAGVERFSGGGAGQWHDGQGACCEGDSCSYMVLEECLGTPVGPGVPCQLGNSPTCEMLRCCAATNGQYWQQEEVECAAQNGEVVEQSLCEPVCCLNGTQADVLSRGYCLDQGGNAHDDPAGCDQVCCIGDLSAGNSEIQVTTAAECAQAGHDLDPVEQCDQVCCRSELFEGFESLLFEESYRFQCLEESDGTPVDDMTQCESICCQLVEEPASILDFQVLSRGSCVEGAGYAVLGPPEHCEEICCLVDGYHQLLTVGECTQYEGEVADPTACEEVCCHTSSGEYLPAEAANCQAEGVGTVVDSLLCEEVCCLLDDAPLSVTRGACQDAAGEEQDADLCADAVCCVLGPAEAMVTTGEECTAIEGQTEPVELCQTVCCVSETGLLKVPATVCSAEEGWTALSPDMCDDICCFVDTEIKEEGGYAEMSKAACLGQIDEELAGEVSPSGQCEEACCLFDGVPISLNVGTCAYIEGEQVPAEDCQQVCCEVPDASPEVMTAEACASAGGEPHDTDGCLTTCCVSNGWSVLSWQVVCSETPTALAYPPDYCEPTCCHIEAGDPAVGGYSTMMKHLCVDPVGLPAGTTQSLADAELCEYVCCTIGEDTGELDKGSCDALGGEEVDVAACDAIGEVCCAFSLTEVIAAQPLDCALFKGQSHPASACDNVCCKAVLPDDFGLSWKTMATMACDALSGDIEADASLCEEICCSLDGSVQTLSRGLCLGAAGSELPDDSQCTTVCCELLDGTTAELSAAACLEVWGDEVDGSQCQKVCCDFIGMFEKLTPSQCDAIFGVVADNPTDCDEVCCLDAEAVEANVVLQGECVAPGVVHPEFDCDAVCCLFQEDGHTVSDWVQRTLCLDVLGGATADFSSCGEVCCAVDGSYVNDTAGTCLGYGGAVEPDETKCNDLCCLTGGQLVLMPPWSCQEGEGTAWDADVCEGSCCTDGTYFEKAAEGQSCAETMFDLEPVPAEQAGQCQTVCCLIEGEYGSEYKGNCTAENGGTVEPDETKCAPVCCRHSGLWQLVEPYVCAADGGIPLPAADCEPMCCNALSTTLTLPAGQCAAFEGTESDDASECDKICCDLLGEFELTTEEACWGEVVVPEMCGTACCQTADTTFLASPESCAFSDGEMAPLAACDPVCCLAENAYELLPTGLCTSLKGEVVADQALCAEVCCVAGGAGIHETAGTCGVLDGVVQEDETPCDQECCIRELSVTLEDPGQCEGDDVVSVEIAGFCGTYCCQVGTDFFDEMAYVCTHDLGGEIPFDPLACDTVCCHQGESYYATELGACSADGGTAEEDSSLCLKVCCDTAGVHAWKSAAECVNGGGQEAADAGLCPATNCDQVLGDSEAVGALFGSLNALTNDNGIVEADCPDNYDTDPNKTSGPDLLVQVTIPAGGCVAAKGVLMGGNPALYVMDACGNIAPSCHLSNYGVGTNEPVYPSVYPFPKPDQTRKAALLYCNASGEEMTVAVWFDSGTDQSAPMQGPMKLWGEPELDQDFSFHWEVMPDAPGNNGPDGAEPLTVDEGEPIGAFRNTTDDYAAAGCPNLADGSGADSGDLFYTFTPDQTDAYVFSLNVLNPNVNTIWKSNHFMALLDAQGTCLWTATGETELRLKEALQADVAYTIVVDRGSIEDNVLFELAVAPYEGPEEDDCDSALAIDNLPATIVSTTIDAFDHVVSTGANCEDLMGSNQGKGQPDVVYSYTPAGNEVVKVTLGSETEGFEPNLIISEACSGKLLQASCFDGLELDSVTSATVTVQLTAGQTYWFIVDGGSSFAAVGEGDFVLTLEPGELTEPDTCAKAQVIPEFPYEFVLNGRNLSNAFSGEGNECTSTVCCKNGEVYDLTTWCEGVVTDDWSKCETVCCDQGDVFSEELRGNCQHYGGEEQCVADLPVSCCQIFAVPQIAYVYAKGCGMPLQGGVQGTPVEPMYCEQVCCEGHGYQKRGNCENFESVSHPFPVPGNSCSYSGDPAGVDGRDAVFKYTASEPGLLTASRVWGSGAFKYLYGVAGTCAEGPILGCDSINPIGTKAVLPLAAGQTGYIVLDGWIEGEIFQSYKVKFDWQPGLPTNVDCNSAQQIGQLPYQVSSSLAGAGNDVVVADSPNCSGLTHTSNGLDTVYRFDPGGIPTDLLAGIISADFTPMLYAVSTCNAPLPLWEECLQSSKALGYVKPLVHLENRSDPVTFVVDSEVGDPWGSYQFALLEATTPGNATCASATVVDALPFTHIGHTIGAGNTYSAPAQTCQFTNWSAVGPGPDVAYRFEISQDFVDQYSGFKAEIAGTTFYTQFWVMKDSCGTDGSTCLRATGTSYQFNGAWDYQVGDVFYFIVDGSNADSQGMYMVHFEGL